MGSWGARYKIVWENIFTFKIRIAFYSGFYFIRLEYNNGTINKSKLLSYTTTTYTVHFILIQINTC